MSSFDYTDNFSGFNDLINRSEFLTEAKQSPYAKYHPSFGGITKDLKAAGFSSAPLDTINFIRTSLYNLELISDEELAAAKKGPGFRAKKDNLIALLDAKEDIIEQNKDEIAKEIEDNLARYINRATTNRGKEEKYAAQKAALELAKDIKAGKDMGDAVENTVGQLDAAESELADSLQMSKEDPTTFIEIKIRDTDRVEDVGNIVSKYANEDGLDISGDTVQFSVDPGTPLYDAVSRHGIDKIEAALKRDVDKISDSVVIVMAPDEDQPDVDRHIKTELPVDISYDIMRRKAREERRKAREEDYEEDMYGMEGDESYAANENEVQEDNEGLSAKKARAGKDIGKPGKNFDKISDKAAKKYGSKEAGDRVAGAVLAKMRGNYEGEEHPAQRAAESIIGAEVMWDGFRKRGQVEEVDVERGIAIVYDEDGGEHMVELGDFDVVNEVEDNENELDHFLTKEQPEDYIPSTDYEDVLDDLVNKDKKEHALKKLNGDDDDPGHIDDMRAEYPPDPFGGGYEDEEEFSYSPMLDSYKTSTANYLTEQAASDKRNKKTEVKNQSFTEKYKPKTHWQLEELRRYGL